MIKTSPANILNFSPDELKVQFKKAGFEPYRADQVLDWIYSKGVYEYPKMSNLSKELQENLAKHFVIDFPRVVERQKSSTDQSVKFLLECRNKDLIECVLMAKENRKTVCISSQVGCKFHCAFCASGQQGFFRNLDMSEIVSQVLLARDLAKDKKLTNIVFMGIGEPFDNYQNVLKAIRVLNSKAALGMGARRMTVSTCGVVPKIEAFSEEGLQVELSISLHGSDDGLRGQIMPVNRAYPVKDLIAACKKYAKKTSRAITFEYILIKGINAHEVEAKSLAKLLKGFLCKVNLIPYNPIEEFPHDRPTNEEILRFQAILEQNGITATVRFSKGRDISAACGQLRSAQLKKGNLA